MVLREARLAPSPLRHALRTLGPLTLLCSVVLTGLLGLLAQSASADHSPDPPAVTADQGPYGTTTSPSWTVTVPADHTLSCTLTGPSAVDVPVSCPSSGGTVSPLSPLDTDGLYTLSAVSERATTYEAATPTVVLHEGGSSAAAVSTYTLDRAVPVLTVTPPSSGVPYASSTGWTVGVSDDSPVTLSCELTAPDTTTTGVTPCAAGAVQPALGADGGYTLTVTATDAAANGVVGSASYSYDGTAPTVTVTGPATSPDSDTRPEFGWSATEGTAQCRLVGPAGVGVVFSGACGTTPFVSPTLSVSGAYTLTVSTADGSGNTASASASYVLDVTPPTVTLSPGSSTGTGATIEWTVGLVDAVSASCVLSNGTTLLSCTDGTRISATLPADGSVTLTVTAQDAYGNQASSSSTYTRATTPAGPVVTPPASPSRSTSVTWEFTTDGLTESVTCRLVRAGVELHAGACTSFAAGSGSGSGSYTRTLTEGDGVYTLFVTAGNSTSSSTTTGSADYTLDTSAPAGPALVAGHSGSTGTASPLSWSWAALTDHTAQCRLTVGTTVSTWTGCTTATSFSVTPSSQGTHTLEVRWVDALGNEGLPSTDSYVYDTVAPVTPTVNLEGGSPRQGGTVVWTVTDVPADAVRTECRLVGGPVEQFATCGTTISRTLTTDGSYTLEVQHVDAAGNRSDVTTSTVVIDGTPPASPTVTGPSGSTNDPTLVWTITPAASDGGSSLECRLVRDGVVPTTFSACASNYTVTDGVYRLDVRAIDDAGNRSEVVSSASVTVDTTGPAAPGVTLAVTSGRTTSATWTVTPAESGTSSECRLLHGGVVVVGWSACAEPYTFDLLEGDGVYTLEVRTRDALGNLGAAMTGPGYTLDATPPAAPSVTGSRSGTDNEREITYAFSGEGTATCRLYRGSTLVATYESCHTTSPFAVTLPGTDGSYTLQVVLTDSFGNESAPGTSQPYVLDVTPPATPTVTGSRTATDNERAITYAFTGEGSAVCELLRDGVVVETLVDCHLAAQPLAVTLPEVSGSYVLRVTFTDAFGNVGTAGSSVAYVLDVTAPGLATVTVTPRTDNVASATWTVTPPEEGTTTQCRLLHGSAVVTDWTACAAPYTYALTEGDGDYVLEVRVVDAVGNVGAVAVGEAYTLDTTPPVAPVVTSDRTVTDNERTVTYAFSGEGTATCTLLRGGTVIAGPELCSSSWTVLLPDVSGSYVLRVTYTDAVGNEGPAGASPAYELDVTPPTTPVVTGDRTGTDNERTITYTFSGEGDASCRLLHDGSPVGDWGACASPWSVTLPGVDGSYVLQVRYTDAVGNTGTAGASVGYALDLTPPPAPTVSGPPATGNATSVTWSFPGEGTATCTLLLDGAVVGSPFACTSGQSFALPRDGSWSLRVTRTDAVGNTGPAGTSGAYLLDTVAPAAPRLAGQTGPAQGRAPSWTLTTDAGSTLECNLVRGGATIADWAPCAGSYTADLTGLPDGGYVLQSRATDTAGNVGAVAASAPYVLDTTAPVAAVVTGPTGPSQDRAPRFTWTGEAGATSQCRLSRDGTVVGEWVACSSGHAPALTADGTWTLAVRLVDAAGNVSAVASSGGYLLDTTPPAAPVVTPPKTPGRDLAPSWGAAVEGGAWLECRLTGPDGVAGSWSPCTLPHATALAGRPDGEYVLEVRATDAAGNLSAVGKASYVLDTVAPAAAVVTAPAAPSRSRTPSFTVTTEPGATTRCRLTSGPRLISDYAPCTTPIALDLTGLPDGTYTLTVRVTDAAGNPGPAATGTYVLDTTGPAAPVLTLSPATPSSARSVTWAWTAEPGSGLICRLTFPTGAVREITGCSSPLTVDLTGLPDGSYTLTVRAVDAAGNVGTALSDSHVIDSTAVAGPGVSGPATPGTTRTPTWQITGTGTECRLTRGSTVLQEWAVCTSTFTADLFGQPDGSYVLAVRTRDAAGSLSAATTSRYVLDTTAPGAVVFVPPSTPSTNRAPAWTLATSELGATAECRLLVFGSVLTSWAPCAVSVEGSVHRIDLTDRGDGTYTLEVRLTDAAGNRGVAAQSSYVLDTSAPVAVGVTGPVSPGKDPTPTWILATGGGAALECRLTSAAGVVSDWAPCDQEYTADLTEQPDGTYTLAVRAVSDAGTPGPESTSAYQLTTEAPTTPVALTGTKSPSRDRAPSWTFTLPPGTTGVCRVVQGTRVVRDGPCSSPFVLDLSGAADGSYTLTVRALDSAGNLSAAVTATYVLDTLPTPAPVLTAEPGTTGSTLDPQWSFTIARGASAECRLLSGGTVLDNWNPCAGSYTALLSGRPDGTYTLQVRAVDDAGNTSPATSSGYLLDRSAAPVPAFLAAPATPSTERSVTWSLSAPAGVTLECRVLAPEGTTAWAACGTTSGLLRTASGAASGAAGSYRLDLAGRPDGDYVLEVRVVEADGRRGAASRSTYRLDTRAPEAPRFTDTPPPAGSAPDPLWLWEDPPEDLVQCRLLRDRTVVTTWTACTSPYAPDLSRLAQGLYVLEIRLVDTAGNVGLITSAGYRYDLTPPAAPVFTSRPPSGGTDRTVSWTFVVPTDATATCSVSRDLQVVVRAAACAGRFDLDLTGRSPGVYTMTVRFTDTAGNVSAPTLGTYGLSTLAASGPVRVDPPPRPAPEPLSPPSAPGAGPLPGPGRGGAGPGIRGPQGFIPAPGVPRLPGEDDLVRSSTAGPVPLPRRGEQAAATEPEDEEQVVVPRRELGDVALGEVPNVIGNVVTETIKRPTLPLALLGIVLLFLLAQNRIDRRDPKLASAPVDAEPELDFTLIVRRPGGAHP